MENLFGIVCLRPAALPWCTSAEYTRRRWNIDIFLSNRLKRVTIYVRMTLRSSTYVRIPTIRYVRRVVDVLECLKLDARGKGNRFQTQLMSLAMAVKYIRVARA